MKSNKPFTANPPEGTFLEIVELDKLIARSKQILRNTKVITISEARHAKAAFDEMYKRRARLTLYAKRALQPSTSD